MWLEHRGPDDNQSARKAIIIGGGIGGVTTALALKRAGMEVAVYERAGALLEVGSGLPLWTNALRALGRLGLTETVKALGAPITTGSVSATTWNGQILTNVSTNALLKRLGTINEVVHRAELLAMLVETLGKEHIHLNSTCVGFTQDAAGVWARFADGSEVDADLLIGADGLHSAIRAQMFGLKKPIYAGYTCWRGVARIERTNLESWVWGRGFQFGITPMSRGRAYWFAQRPAPEGEPERPCGRKREVLDMFQGWHDPVPAVIEATDEAHILRNDIYRSAPLRCWTRRRVALLGDAAHTMTPDLGQGACQAIEDAVTLADCLQAEAQTELALKCYEKRRLQRANRVALLAELIGKAVHIENPLLASMRNAIVKLTPGPVLMQLLMPILDYNP